MRVKSSGMVSGLANAQPRAVQNLQIPRSSPGWGEDGGGGGGFWALLELTDALN